MAEIRARRANGRERYLAALEDRLASGPSPENWDKTREAIKDHLEEYLKGEVRRVDAEIAAFMVAALKQAQAGAVPELFKVARRGRRTSAALALCFKAAGTYIQFCLDHAGQSSRDGANHEIQVDAAPVQTVKKLFGVDDRTAQRWKQRAVIVEDIEQYSRVRSAMRTCAKQYVRFGGASAKAIGQRRTKG